MVLGAWIHRRLVPGRRAPSQRENAIMSNSRGFAAFPTELLHHIASHIPGATVAWYRLYDYQRDERRETLRALSQLSRSLRVAFLPLVWQSLLACNVNLDPEDGVRISQTKAERKLLGQLTLVRNRKQPYASYVRWRLSLFCSGLAVHHS